jgi:hypothetical protein
LSYNDVFYLRQYSILSSHHILFSPSTPSRTRKEKEKMPYVVIQVNILKQLLVPIDKGTQTAAHAGHAAQVRGVEPLQGLVQYFRRQSDQMGRHVV